MSLENKLEGIVKEEMKKSLDYAAHLQLIDESLYDQLAQELEQVKLNFNFAKEASQESCRIIADWDENFRELIINFTCSPDKFDLNQEDTVLAVKFSVHGAFFIKLLSKLRKDVTKAVTIPKYKIFVKSLGRYYASRACAYYYKATFTHDETYVLSYLSLKLMQLASNLFLDEFEDLGNNILSVAKSLLDSSSEKRCIELFLKLLNVVAAATITLASNLNSQEHKSEIEKIVEEMLRTSVYLLKEMESEKLSKEELQKHYDNIVASWQKFVKLLKENKDLLKSKKNELMFRFLDHELVITAKENKVVFIVKSYIDTFVMLSSWILEEENRDLKELINMDVDEFIESMIEKVDEKCEKWLASLSC